MCLTDCEPYYTIEATMTELEKITKEFFDQQREVERLIIEAAEEETDNEWMHETTHGD